MAYIPPLNGGRLNASLSGNSTSAGAGYQLMSTGTMYLAGGNNITLSQNGASVTISGANAPSGSINFSASNTSANLASVTFSNSNGLSFGLSNGVITGSHNGITSQSVQTQSNIQGIIASGSTNRTGDISFANSNGVTFGLSNNTVTASYTVPTQSNQTISYSAGSQSTLTATGTFDARSLYINGVGNISAGFSQSSIFISGSQSAQTQSNIQGIIASGSTNRTGDISFANSNGITFGLSNNTVTASYTVPSQSNQTNGYYITGNTTATAGGGSTSSNPDARSITISAAGAISAGWSSNSQLVLSVPTQTVQTQNLMTVNGTQGNVSISGGANVTVGNNASTITISAAAQTNQTLSFAVTASSAGNTSGMSVDARSLTLQGLGAASVGLSTSNGGSTLLISATQSNQAVSAGTHGSFTFQTLSLANSNGVSWSTGTQGLYASVAGGGGAALSAGTQSVNTGTVNFANSNNITFGMSGSSQITASYSQSNQTQGFTAGTTNNGNTSLTSTGTFDARSVYLNAHGGISAGFSSSSMFVSAPATSSLVGTGGISISTNGSTISVSYGPKLSRWEYPDDVFGSIGTVPQGSLSIQHMYVPFNVSGSAAKVGGSLTINTFTTANSTATANISLWMGLYTLNGSTLSLASSGSANNSFAWSGSASSTGYSTLTGMRQLTVPMNANITPGEYWVAAVMSTATTNAGLPAFTIFGNSLLPSGANAGILSPIGLNSTAASAQRDVDLFEGIYTAATSAGPSSIGSADINNTSASNLVRANFYNVIYNATY